MFKAVWHGSVTNRGTKKLFSTYSDSRFILNGRVYVPSLLHRCNDVFYLFYPYYSLMFGA